MDLPFNKIVVDSRHAANGDANNFDITLPESLTLPPNAICYCTDIAIPHMFSSMGSGPSLRNTFYWVERIGDASSLDYLTAWLLTRQRRTRLSAWPQRYTRRWARRVCWLGAIR